MSKKAFTLIELLVVVAIMGLLGTVSVGGYRQMQQGMEERGVVDNMSRFIALAAERAQIDRQVTAVYCWNEMLREQTEDENEIIVGKAVAIRAKGRISRKDGNLLIDEFGDLEQFDEEYGDFADAGTKEIMPKRLYFMDKLKSGGKIGYSVVRDIPQTKSGNGNDPGQREIYLNSYPISDNQDNVGNGGIVQFGYYIDGDEVNVSWKNGSIYGMEFQEIELPHGYVFGSSVPSSMSAPIKEVVTLVFDAEMGSSSGAVVGQSTVDIYALRPGQSGSLTPLKIGTTTKPNAQLN